MVGTFFVVGFPQVRNGGGTTLGTSYSITTDIATTTLNIPANYTNASANLSAFTGQTVQVCFVETIPELFTGPGFSELDNVSLIFTQGQAVADPIPTMSEWGLMIFGLVVLNLSIYFLRRKESFLA